MSNSYEEYKEHLAIQPVAVFGKAQPKSKKNDDIKAKYCTSDIAPAYTIGYLKELMNDGNSVFASRRKHYQPCFIKWARWVIANYGSKHSKLLKAGTLICGYRFPTIYRGEAPKPIANVESIETSAGGLLVTGGVIDGSLLVRATISNSTSSNSNEPVKSDGGKSSYYHKTIPDWLVKRIQDKGNVIEVEDIIRLFFGNDFDYGTAFKSLVRMYAANQGGGKAGNSVEYEHNKVAYYVDKSLHDYEDINGGK